MKTSNLTLKEIREKLELTQKNLSDELGLGVKTISNYETGHPIPESIRKLIDFYYFSKVNKSMEIEHRSNNTNEIDLLKREIESLKKTIIFQERILESNEKLIKALENAQNIEPKNSQAI